MLTSKRILVVDDEPSSRLLIARVLQKAGCVVHTAPSAEDALKLLESERVDLLVVDKNLPRMNGLELIRQVRALSPALPVVLITAAMDLQPGERLRVEAFVAKPFSLQDLQDAVRSALEARAQDDTREELKQQLFATLSRRRSGPGSGS